MIEFKIIYRILICVLKCRNKFNYVMNSVEILFYFQEYLKKKKKERETNRIKCCSKHR